MSKHILIMGGDIIGGGMAREDAIKTAVGHANKSKQAVGIYEEVETVTPQEAALVAARKEAADVGVPVDDLALVKTAAKRFQAAIQAAPGRIASDQTGKDADWSFPERLMADVVRRIMNADKSMTDAVADVIRHRKRGFTNSADFITGTLVDHACLGIGFAGECSWFMGFTGCRVVGNDVCFTVRTESKEREGVAREDNACIPVKVLAAIMKAARFTTFVPHTEYASRRAYIEALAGKAPGVSMDDLFGPRWSARGVIFHPQTNELTMPDAPLNMQRMRIFGEPSGDGRFELSVEPVDPAEVAAYQERRAVAEAFFAFRGFDSVPEYKAWVDSLLPIAQAAVAKYVKANLEAK